MAINTVQTDRVNYQMTTLQGHDPRVIEQAKPGLFGRLFSGIGRVLGAVAAPLSFIFPPAALVAAGSYGLATTGDGMQQRAAQKVSDKVSRDRMTNVSFPGLGNMEGSQFQPAAGTLGANDAAIMQVLGARGDTMLEMSKALSK